MDLENEKNKEKIDKKLIKQDIEKQSNEPSTPYLAARFIEIICIGAFIFGFLWNGTEVLNLTTPQFMMLYGGTGAVVSEILARLFKKKQNII